MIKCKNYIYLPIKQFAFDHLKISSEEFPLLMEILKIVELNNKMIRTIRNNLPPNYDLNSFSEELIREITRPVRKIIFYTDRSIEGWDIDCNDRIFSVKNHLLYNYGVTFSPDGTKIFIGGYSLSILCAKTGELLIDTKKMWFPDENDNMINAPDAISPDNLKMI